MAPCLTSSKLSVSTRTPVPRQPQKACCHCHVNHGTQLQASREAQPLAEPQEHASTPPAALAAAAAAWSMAYNAAAAAADAGSGAGDAAAAAAAATAGYVPGPVEVGWQIWFASFVATVPFVIGAYEFGKRILIQRRCQVCSGKGLVTRGDRLRKCPECGGFFPWISWRMFLSANTRPGNGGPLLQPKGQTSVFYRVPPLPSAEPQPQQSGAFQLPGVENGAEPVSSSNSKSSGGGD